MTLFCIIPILISVTFLQTPGAFGDDEGENFETISPQEYENYRQAPQLPANYRSGFKQLTFYEEVGSAKFEEPSKWVQNFILSKSGVLAGREQSYGDAYVCRVSKDKEIIPGKYYAYANLCFVVADGSEFEEKNCEILRACQPDQYQWIPILSHSATVPSDAVIGGNSKSNENYYICRGAIDDEGRNITNMILPGKFQASKGTCLIAYRGVNVGSNIEILVEKDPNICT